VAQGLLSLPWRDVLAAKDGGLRHYEKRCRGSLCGSDALQRVNGYSAKPAIRPHPLRVRLGMTMTCRIDRLVIGEDLVILCISGQITGQDVDMLRDLLDHEKNAIAIDLKEVLLVDREAVRLLALSETNGTELKNCPAYVREWIIRERALR
jgi:hypothetical protein